MHVAKAIKFLPYVPVFLGSLLVGCHEPASPINKDKGVPQKTVSVAAASDLKFAFDEVIGRFHRVHPAIHVQITYGSSGNFFAQLTNRAPFDIFFSADAAYPRQLADRGLADQQSLFTYAVGHIVVWVPKESSIDLEKLGMQAVLDPSVKKVAIANPIHAPYGRAAEAAMKSLGVYASVQDRLVFGENVAQTAQFVESGSADVGIIAESLARAPAMREKGHYWVIPLDAYPPLEQVGVVLTWASDREATECFREFVEGQEGRQMLGKYGFTQPGD